MRWDNGLASGSKDVGLMSGSLNGIEGYEEAILQNGHEGLGSMA